MRLQSEIRKKAYTPARLSKLTPEQANLILIGHASCGDQGAKDLLDVLYPLPEPERNHSVREFRRPGACPNHAWNVRLIGRAWRLSHPER